MHESNVTENVTENVVEISQLTFSYDGRVIFKDLNIAVKKGKVTAIMGPSGSGKTTLLRLIGGLALPDKGKVTVNGLDLYHNGRTCSQKMLYQLREKMGLLFQSNALFTHLSVFENVAFPLREHWNIAESKLQEIVLQKLEAVGLRGAAHLMPAELSGGMSRRVALARAIALDPGLMMYDEPFTGQDPIAMGVLLRLIKDINQMLQTTTVIVSHDVQETCSIADEVYLIANGAVLASGEPNQLLTSKNPAIRQFMHGEVEGVIPFHYSNDVSRGAKEYV